MSSIIPTYKSEQSTAVIEALMRALVQHGVPPEDLAAYPVDGELLQWWLGVGQGKRITRLEARVGLRAASTGLWSVWVVATSEMLWGERNGLNKAVVAGVLEGGGELAGAAEADTRRRVVGTDLPPAQPHDGPVL